MADPDFRDFNTYFPYRDDRDALKIADQAFTLGLKSIPESANPNQSKSTDHRSSPSNGNFFSKGDGRDDPKVANLLDICAETDERKTRLENWILYFRDEKHIKVDIGRITRLAIHEGWRDLVEYLVEDEHAELGQRDKFGRSAISYAARLFDLAMLEYVASKLDPDTVKREMSYQDEYKKTPLHYAMICPRVANVEFCLAAGAIPDKDLVASLSKNWDPLTRFEIRLLFTLYTQREKYLNFLVYAENRETSSTEKRVALFTLKELQTDPGLLTDVHEMERLGYAAKGLTWIHIPWTNGVLLFMALRAIQKRIQNRPRKTSTITMSKISEFFKDCFRDPVVVPGDPDLNFREPVHTLGTRNPLDEASFAAIVFPCLILKEIKDFAVSRSYHRDHRKPIDEPLAKTLIQVERTLDEAYYPSLNKEAFKTRNKNQVVLKAYENLVKGENVSEKPRPILVVPQFWIWKFEDHILSAYSAPGKGPKDVYEYEFDDNLRYVNHRINREGPSWMFDNDAWKSKYVGTSTKSLYEHPDLQIGVLLAGHIENFGNAQANDKFQSPLDIFEIGVVQVLSRMDEYVNSSQSGSPKIEEEWDLMKNISNIRSELAMIHEILRQQKQILNSLIDNVNPSVEKERAWREVVDANQRLESYQQRLQKIDRDAQRTEKDIQDRLNLVRTHASMRDARTGLALSTAVIGFTIVTIIFAPLGFMNGLLGLPVDRFVNHKFKDTYRTQYVGLWFAVAEIVSLVGTGLLVLVSLRLLGFFHRTGDGLGQVKRKNPGRSAEDDGKETSSDSKTTKPLNPRRFRKRPENGENIEV